MRAAAVLEHLGRMLPIRLTVVAGCDRRVWPASLLPLTEAWHDEPADVGVLQSDDVTVDLAATGASVERWLESLPAIARRETERLERGFQLVLGDVPSPAFQAADSVGIPSVAVANFTWDWIYSELGFASAAAAARTGYHKATVLLEATPSGPMTAFRRRIDVGLVARTPRRSRAAARAALGLGDGQSVALLAFQPASAPALKLPRPRPGRCYLAPGRWPARFNREDVRVLPREAGFEDALAACDVVIGKPGYGLIGDVEVAGTRFLYVPRPGFPENALLERHLRARSGTAAVSAQELARGSWEDDLAALESGAAPVPAEAGGALRAAGEIAAMLGVDSGQDPD